jgi:hypothetical protein
MNEDKTFYIDAAAFPGNSGSPVFLKPSLVFNENREFVTSGGGNFSGVIGEYLPYQEVAVSVQTGLPRVIFQENTGLSRVWSTSFITEIINSNAFTEQINRLRDDHVI